tara:strand:- start:32 stop:382 length:351 start_codon:yes stop_codon:yes gene_type:complete
MNIEKTLGTIIGLEDYEHIVKENKLKQLEKKIHFNYKKLKKLNNKHLEKIIKIHERKIKDDIEEYEMKCDAFLNILKYLTKQTSLNLVSDRNDEKEILNQYKYLQNKIQELNDLLI